MNNLLLRTTTTISQLTRLNVGRRWFGIRGRWQVAGTTLLVVSSILLRVVEWGEPIEPRRRSGPSGRFTVLRHQQKEGLNIHAPEWGYVYICALVLIVWCAVVGSVTRSTPHSISMKYETVSSRERAACTVSLPFFFDIQNTKDTLKKLTLSVKP